uniref:Crassicorin-I n=1 Tax=Urticina crassicornis TaxID=45621 RepID=BDS1_URTCR|nr:RecName: Full=Crassicorin-I; AltName: Full=BDS-like antimicrobial peptide; Short=BDS-like AMP; Flags: Precursor [Urticina crassicornis]ARQ30160.1 crassicorin-I [Urticina crassicornis]
MKLFLVSIVLVGMLVLAAARPERDIDSFDEQEEKGFVKRGASCDCHPFVGTYWFGISNCPSGHGYRKKCASFFGVCCVK